MYSGGSCSKLVEYSGNTNGIVSRVLGKGWPKELVKVKCILGMSPVSISSPHNGMDTSSTELRSGNKKPTDMNQHLKQQVLHNEHTQACTVCVHVQPHSCQTHACTVTVHQLLCSVFI